MGNVLYIAQEAIIIRVDVFNRGLVAAKHENEMNFKAGFLEFMEAWDRPMNARTWS